jgi:hypothetical protein
MRHTVEELVAFGKQCFEARKEFDTWEEFFKSISITTRSEDYMEVAEKVYRHMNPNGTMCTPNSAYITTEKWYHEWQNEDTEMSLFDWVIKNKK